jgi:hypothetical protein
MDTFYGFEITRIGQTKETVHADSMTIEAGDAPKYVFRKDDKLVREIFIHALEIEPKASHILRVIVPIAL